MCAAHSYSLYCTCNVLSASESVRTLYHGCRHDDAIGPAGHSGEEGTKLTTYSTLRAAGAVDSESHLFFFKFFVPFDDR